MSPPPSTSLDPEANINQNRLEQTLKRRKVRRGTSSCWECKHRKIRCDFDANSDTPCISCKRRGTRCVSQQFFEDTSISNEATYHRVEKHVDRVESMVNHLIQQPIASMGSSHPVSNTASTASLSSSSACINRLSTHSDGSKRGPHINTSGKKRKLVPRMTQDSRANEPMNLMEFRMRRQNSNIGPRNPFTLSQLVHSYLPPMRLIVKILGGGGFRSLPIQTLRIPLRRFINQPSTLQPLQDSGSIQPTSPPILLAKKLLQLAICLQQIDPSSDEGQLRLDGPLRSVADQFFNAASGYVTSQDRLVISIDGLETLMLEGYYHVNVGEYKLAWLVFQRAMGIAQMLGLDTPQLQDHGNQSSPEQQNLSQSQMWFRLVYIHRFISMMLGLPTVKSNNDINDDEELATQEGLGQLERYHSTIMRKICCRNERLRQYSGNGTFQDGGGAVDETQPSHNTNGLDMNGSYQQTQEIDNQLQRAMKTMPVRWWTIPTRGHTSSEIETKSDLARVIMQMHQYNLLACLHAPYIVKNLSMRTSGTFPSLATTSATSATSGISTVLRNSATSTSTTPSVKGFAYNKFMALHASRESIHRFPIFANSDYIPSFPRGVNFKVLISGIIILLAHLDEHCLNGESSLEHQRPQDLQLVDFAIEALEDLAKKRRDLMDDSSIQLLRKLMEIEEDSANGTEYTIWKEDPVIGEIECSIKEVNCGFELMVPTLGKVQIIRNICNSHSEAGVSNPDSASTWRTLVQSANSTVTDVSWEPMGFTSVEPSWEPANSWDNSELVSSSDLNLPALALESDDFRNLFD
jgi:hypothetical protein